MIDSKLLKSGISFLVNAHVVILVAVSGLLETDILWIEPEPSRRLVKLVLVALVEGSFLSSGQE
jgi:hypothetical protein